MTVIYFTATGNCLYAARGLGSSELLSIPQMIKQGRYEFSDDAIGFVFPVYGWYPMQYALDYIKKCKFDTDYLFAILTYGMFSSASERSLYKFGKRNGICFDYINRLKMTDNYLPLFSMKSQKEIEVKKNIDLHLKTIKADIVSRKTRKPSVNAFFPISAISSYSSVFRQGRGAAGSFYVDNTCIGCSSCVSVCPTGNVLIKNNTPLFGSQCLSCLACIQNCPMGAVHMRGEKSGERFRNSSINLKGIIDSNKQ